MRELPAVLHWLNESYCCKVKAVWLRVILHIEED
jgi:hypothetical protein